MSLRASCTRHQTERTEPGTVVHRQTPAAPGERKCNLRGPRRRQLEYAAKQHRHTSHTHAREPPNGPFCAKSTSSSTAHSDGARRTSERTQCARSMDRSNPSAGSKQIHAGAVGYRRKNEAVGGPRERRSNGTRGFDRSLAMGKEKKNGAGHEMEGRVRARHFRLSARREPNLDTPEPSGTAPPSSTFSFARCETGLRHFRHHPFPMTPPRGNLINRRAERGALPKEPLPMTARLGRCTL